MIAIKRCHCADNATEAATPALWRKCSDDWYMPKFTHAGKTYRDNVTRWAAVILGKTITTATEADAVITDHLRPAIKTGTYVSAKATVRLALTKPRELNADATIADVITAFTADVIGADQSRTKGSRRYETRIVTALGAFVPPGRRVAFGQLPIAAPSDDDVRADLKAWRLSLGPLKNNTWAKHRSILGQLFRYAVDRRYRATDPLATAPDHDRKALRRGKSETRRTRISPAEEARLLSAAAADRHAYRATWLVDLITAAIVTGMRLGELLALQWADVDLAAGVLYVRAVEVGARKTLRGRPIPIFARLRRVLDARHAAAAGTPAGARTAYVFGHATGGKVARIWRPWSTAVLLAHGHAATWRSKKGGATANHMTAASAAVLRKIDWHFHDLRHEAGCRWLESKLFDLEQIRQLYGHATIAQTAKYLHAATGSALKVAAEYDAYVARLDTEAATAAANALAAGRTGHKSGTNRKPTGRPGPGPRLIKGGKS